MQVGWQTVYEPQIKEDATYPKGSELYQLAGGR